MKYGANFSTDFSCSWFGEKENISIHIASFKIFLPEENIFYNTVLVEVLTYYHSSWMIILTEII